METEKDRLFKYVLSFVSYCMEKTESVSGKKVLKIDSMNIYNKHGLEIEGCDIVQDSSGIEIKASYNFRDFLPCKPGLKTTCTIYGKELEPTLKEFVEHLNKKIYCRDCGKLGFDSEYVEAEGQCVSCVLETLLFLEKERQFCSICQTETPRYITLSCGHTFHRKCISKVLKNKCPLCQRQISV